MAKLLGKKGLVDKVDEDGDVFVLGKCWNPELVKAGNEGRPKVGEKVELSGDEDLGVLKQGEEGTLVQDDGSDLPFQVRAHSGATYWFKATDVKRSTKASSRGSVSSGEVFREGEVVRIRSVPVTEARELMEGKGGWVDSMEPMLGTTGAITQVLADRLRIGGKVWALELVERVSGRLQVGELVQLVLNFGTFGDASEGPLKIGEIGVVEADDHDSKPFKVKLLR